MKPAVRLLALAALGAAVLLAQGQNRRRHDFNLNVQDRNSENCAGLQAEARGGELAQATESFTMARSQAPTLEIGSIERGNVRVIGAYQADYTVEVCKFAVAADRATAELALRAVAVSHNGGKISTNNPSGIDADWTTYVIVHAPKDASLDLDATNGALAVRDVDGQIKMHAVNGPIAVKNCGGRVDANTQNGPIAFEGSGGDIHLKAQNGPIAVKLSSDFWNGNQLEAHTDNGPVSLKMPDNFRSAVRVESDGHSPMSCKATACANAVSDLVHAPRVLQLNGSEETIHISTHNGPIAVAAEGNSGRVI